MDLLMIFPVTRYKERSKCIKCKLIRFKFNFLYINESGNSLIQIGKNEYSSF